MSSRRFTLALDQLAPEDWRDFERLAAEFIAVEYPSLRTMASASGDKGRDGELYFPDEARTSTVLQYSVTADWQAKIISTVKRLEENFDSITILIYATNQLIGPSADELKTRLRSDHAISLDVRDRSWFVEREFTSPQRQIAATELAERYVDPLLRGKGVLENVGTVLDDDEGRIALLHLALDVEDKATNKGLTKSCFESLALCALEGTSLSATITLGEVQARVRKFVPAENRRQVDDLVSSALKRLTVKGGPVKHHKQEDAYCLSHSSVLETKERIAKYVSNEGELENHLVELAEPLLTSANPEQVRGVGRELRQGIDHLLSAKGEAFARAVTTGRMPQLDASEAANILRPLLDKEFALSVEQSVGVIFDAIQRPTHATQEHLRRLADSYTLFAFLRQTPDVQKAVVKIFSGGRIWLDTTVILPMLGETLITERSERHFTVLLRAARDAGIGLFVTDGVVEEVERHINMSVTFARGSVERWRSRVPFLYSVYAMTGRNRFEFPSWASQFRGDMRPEDDVAEALHDLFGIRRRNLLEYSDNASTELRGAVQEVWQETHDRRRKADNEDDMGFTARARLVAHDVENCVGVIEMRKEHPSSPVGYRAWLLTMDRTAFRLVDELPARLGQRAPASPILSPDFLSEYLRLGSARTAVESELRVNLPILTDIGRIGNLPATLVTEADSVRQRYANLDERLIQREVRDSLDRERLRLGLTAGGGLQSVEEGFAQKLRP